MSDNNKVYRVGIIGCGRVASTIEDEVTGSSSRIFLPYSHAGAYTRVPQCQIVAVADVDRAKMDDFARRWGAVNCYTDYQEMLRNESLDIVSVCTRAPLHAENTIAAAEAGVKAIFCEKAMATSLAEADEMIEVCRRHGAKLTINHSRVWDPFYRKARELVESGVIGELQSVVALSRGGLAHMGTHIFAILHYLVGADVEWAFGQLDGSQNNEADPGGTGYLQFKNGVPALVTNRRGNSTVREIDLIGTDGRIRLGNLVAELWTVDSTAGRRREMVQRAFPQAMFYQSTRISAIQELIACIEQGTESSCNGEDGRAALEMTMAFHESHDKGGTVVPFPVANRTRSVISV